MRKESSAHENRPRNHMRKVHTGSDVSSVLGTVSRTCSTGESSSSSIEGSSVSFLLGSRSISTVPILFEKGKQERREILVYCFVWSILSI